MENFHKACEPILTSAIPALYLIILFLFKNIIGNAFVNFVI